MSGSSENLLAAYSFANQFVAEMQKGNPNRIEQATLQLKSALARISKKELA